MTVPMWLALIITAWIVGLEGLGPPQWLYAWARGKQREQEEKAFIEETVRGMEADPRAAEAIYAQPQYHATNPSLVIALIALLISYLTSTWGSNLQWLALAFIWPLWIGYRAMDKTITRSHLYIRVIDRYCERLHLPKRPE